MIEEKRDIILTEGVPVDIVDFDGTVTPTLAIIGRASRQSSAVITLEAHRRGIFLPEIDLRSGSVVISTVTNERYLAVGLMKEQIGTEIASIISHMMLCNTKMSLSTLAQTVNSRGDVVKGDVAKYTDLDVFTQAISSELRQQNAGLLHDAEYLIYAPEIEASLLDKLTLTVGTRKTPLKVVNVDYVTYPGITLVQACSETRK
jgi:hypothetical protein